MKQSILFLLLLVDWVSCYRILVFAPKFGVSHTNFLGKVADTLVDAGHDVTVYSPNIHPHVYTTKTKAKAIDAEMNVSMDLTSAQKHVWEDSFASYIELSKIALKPTRDLIKALYHSDGFQAWVRAQNIDISISEGIVCFDGLLYLLGIRKFVVTVSTNPIDPFSMLMGIPNAPSFVPVNNKGFSVPMTYWERAQNLFELVFTTKLIEYSLEPELDGYFDERFGKDAWSVRRQAQQVSYVMVNNDEVLDFPRFTTPKWHYIGGLRRQHPKPLTPEWEKVFASSKRGVILMSFGTMARSTDMGEARRSAFVKAFEAFPDITFIWRYENSSHRFTNASNIILHEWLPQVDMLSNKRMLAFICHGGMGGVFESTYAGLPVIVIPLFADQLRNARMMEYRGMGVVINKSDLTESRIVNAIKEILKPKYAKAARRLSEQLRNKPFTPEDILVRHVENAVRFNVTATLNNIFAQQSFAQYYMLDIIVPFLVIVASMTIIFIKIACACFLFVARILLSLPMKRTKAKQN